MTDEYLKMDDAQGNRTRCGHPFGPHVITAFDVTDFGKGGRCICESTVSFNVKLP